MRSSIIGRARQAAHGLTDRFAPKSIILLYHRIADVRPDPWSLCVTPQHFAEHLEVLRQQSHPMRLQQLVSRLRDSNLPRHAVAITFDDGYADNLLQAKPALERYDIPATVFVATGNIEQAHEFWWDELERLLLQPGTLPEELRLSIDGKTYRWELGDAACYREEAFQRDQNWIAWGENDPSARHTVYRVLWELLHPLRQPARQQVLAELIAWAGAESAGRASHRSLERMEIVALADEGLVEVGVHTVTHPTLSALPVFAQRNEIRESKAYLEQLLQRPMMSFSYPFGRQSDYTMETVALVGEAGFVGACSNFPGVVKRSSDPYQLPRINVPDCDGQEFARFLAMSFDPQ